MYGGHAVDDGGMNEEMDIRSEMRGDGCACATLSICCMPPPPPSRVVAVVPYVDEHIHPINAVAILH